MTNVLALLVVVAVLGAPRAHAQLKFFEPFDAENGGNPVLNFSAFTQFTVTQGSVDLLGPGVFDFIPGNGLYLDMDGTTNAAGTIESIVLPLPAGGYQLSFDLSFNPNVPVAKNTMLVEVASVAINQYIGGAGLSASQFVRQSFNFTLSEPASGSIVFAHTGNDTGGYLLDDVVLVLLDCVADVNNDGILSPADFNAWIVAFNVQSPACDQNNDGACTPADFNAWVANYNAGC